MSLPDKIQAIPDKNQDVATTDSRIVTDPAKMLWQKTKLSPEEEATFLKWLGNNPDTDLYDWRGFFKSEQETGNLKPTLDTYFLENPEYHAYSIGLDGVILKSPQHPTFSKTVNSEKKLGNVIINQDNRIASHPKDTITSPSANEVLPDSFSLSSMGGTFSSQPREVANTLPSLNNLGEFSDFNLNRDFGLLSGMDQQSNRASNQSGWDLTKGVLVQSLSELVLGTAEGVGYLLDIPQWIDIIRGKEEEFGNWFSDWVKEGKESLRDFAPIYTTENDRGFNPSSVRWWASNVPSIVSAVSLAIPSTLAVKGLSTAARFVGGAKVLDKLGRGQQLAAKGLGAAIFSRYMENTMEASQVYDNLYHQAIQDGRKDQEAKRIAGEGARTSWYANLSNLAFDIPQYLTMFRGFDFLSKSVKSTPKLTTGLLRNATQEGIEEVNQFIIGKEAERGAQRNNQLKFNNSSFSQRLAEYAKDGELWTAFTFGALGGGLFNYYSNYVGKKQAIKNKINNTFVDSAIQKEESAITGNQEQFNESRDEDFIKTAISHADRGTLDQMKKDLSVINNLTEEEAEELQINKEELTDLVNDRISEIDQIQTDYINIQNNPNKNDESTNRFELGLKSRLRHLNKYLQRIKGKVTNMIQNAFPGKEVSSDLANYYYLNSLKSIFERQNDLKNAKRISEQADKLAKLIIESDAYPNIKSIEQLNKEINSPEDTQILKEQEKLANNFKEIQDTQEKLNSLNTESGYNKQKNELNNLRNEEAQNTLQDLVNSIHSNTDALSIEALRQVALEDGLEKEFDGLVQDKINELKISSPAPLLLEGTKGVGIYDRYNNNDLLRRAEYEELSGLLGTPITNLSDIEEFIDQGDEARNLVYDYYKNIADRINQFNSGTEEGIQEITEYSNREDTDKEETYQNSEPSANDQLENPFFTIAFQFEIERIPNTDKFRTVYEGGNPKETPKNDLGVDWNWVNNKNNLKPGTKLYYEIDLENDFNAKLSGDQLIQKGQILVTHYIDGNTNNKDTSNRKVVASVRGYDSKRNWISQSDANKLKELREDVFAEARDSGLSTGNFLSSISTNVKQKLSGRFYSTSTRNKPSEILKEEDELVFGLGIDNKGITTLEIPNNPEVDKQVTVSGNVTPGAVYQIVPAANGILVPYRIFTKKLKDNKDLLNRALTILEDSTPENWKQLKAELLNIVYVDYIITPENKLRVKNKDNNWETIEDRKAWLSDKIIQVDRKRLNTTEYNNEVDNLIETDMKPYEYVHSTKIETETYNRVAQKDSKDFKPVDTKSMVVTPDESSLSGTKPGPKIKKVKGAGSQSIKFGDNNTKFRIQDSQSYIPWNREQDIKWFEDRFPQVPIEVLDNLKEIHKNGGIKAWGMFHNASAYIWKNAAQGTVQHEGFHVVFNMFLNEDQRNKILEEKKFSDDRFNKLDNLTLEELLADDFAEYVNSQNETGLGYRVKKFFNNLYQFLKSLFTDSINISELFYRTQEGFYRNKQPLRTGKDFNTITRFKLDNINPILQKRRVDMLNFQFFEVVDTLRNEVEEYNNLNDLEIIKDYGVPNIYTRVYNGLIDAYNDSTQDNNTVRSEQLLQVIENLITVSDEGFITGYGDYYYLSVKDLGRYNIKIKLVNNQVNTTADSAEDLTPHEIDDNENRLEGWQVKYISTSGKDTLSYNVKKALRRTIELEKINDSFVPLLDDIGFNRFIDFNTLYNYLERNLADIYDSDLMLDRLRELTQIRPEIRSVIRQLESDDSLRASFFSNFSKTHAPFLFIDQDKRVSIDQTGSIITNTRFRVFNSNRKNTNQLLIDEWKQNFTNPNRNEVTNKDGSINKEKATTYFNQIFSNAKKVLSVGRVTQEDANLASSLLLKFGIEISPEILINESIVSAASDTERDRAVAYSNFFLKFQNLITILGAVKEGINPYTEGGEFTSLQNISKRVAQHSLDLFQASFVAGDGATVYSYLPSNFLAKFTSSLKTNDKVLDSYLTNDYYRNNIWLNEIKSNSTSRNELQYHLLDAARLDNKDKGTRYTSMSKKDIEVASINAFYNNNSKYAHYRFPIPSDSPQLPFVKFKKYSDNEIIDHLYTVAVQEYNRIRKVESEIANLPDNEKIKNYHTNRGTRYNYITVLNGYEGNINNAVEVKRIIREWLGKEYNKDLASLREIGILNESNKSIDYIDNRITDQNAFLRNYFANSVLANIQMIQLYSGDLAFYKNTGDFQKRNSQAIKPGVSLDTKGRFVSEDGEVVSVREQYNTIYINDNIINSTLTMNIQDMLESLGVATERAKEIANQYKNVNETDAQAYITLDRFREILVGRGQWTNKHNEAYRRLKQGKGLSRDFNLVLQPIKPFYFGHINKEGTIVPVQNKNSEFVILPQLAERFEPLNRLLQFMNTNGVDSVQFDSAVKVGQFGAVSFEDSLGAAIVHKLDNANYVIQQEVPEHHIDADNIFGTQIRKLILADLNPNTTYFRGLNGNQTSELYQDIIEADLIESFNNTEERTSTPEKIQEILLEEVIDRNMGTQFEDSLELLPDKSNFDLPLYFPILARRNEALLNSIFNNNIVKQKINGGSFVQVSAFGFSEDLKVNIDPQTNKLLSLDVYMPWWSRKFFPTLPNGEVDINRVPENLRELVGYRIPTEGKYSMAPLRVVGFLPQESGGAIVLPSEITTISGSDFDIDKLYVMIPNFEVIDGEPVKIEYNFDQLPGIQSKEARDNAKIDIIRNILTNSQTFEQFITPGGFENLKSLANEINKLEGVTADGLNPIFPRTQDELFIRNITGKELVGIFANHNAHHSSLQYSDVEFIEVIAFEGQRLNKLNKQKNVDGEYISKSLASLLAASVDNAKEPIANFLNFNTYTADTVATLLRVGVPERTAISFIAQPILKEFVSKLVNIGATSFNEEKLFDEIEKKYKSKVPNYEALVGIQEFSEGELFTNINESKNKDKSDRYYISQLEVLKAFKKYKEMANSLSSLVNASRADATKRAIPTIAGNEILLDNVAEAEVNPRFKGVEDFFDITQGYKIQAIFTEYGVRRPNEILKKYFPYAKRAFSSVKAEIERIKGFPLTGREIDNINTELLTYIVSGFSFFGASRREEVLNSIGNRVNKAKESESTRDNPFIKRLRVVTDENNKGFDAVEFVNNGSLTNEERDFISQGWEYLINNSESEADRQLGQDLILYTFYTHGFRFTSSSFSHLAPVSFFKNLRQLEGDESFGDYLRKIVDEADDANIYRDFVDQFVRNNSNTDFIPTYTTSTITGIKQSNGTPYSIIINPNTVKSKAHILGTDEDGNTIFVPYIKSNVGQNTYLFRYVGNLKGNEDVGVYYLSPNLGLKNEVIEYERENPFPDSFLRRNRIDEGSENLYYTLSESYTTQNRVEDDIDGIELFQLDSPENVENFYNLRNEDGSLKRFPSFNSALDRAKTINDQLSNTNFRASIKEVKEGNSTFKAIEILNSNEYQLEGEKIGPNEELNNRLKGFLNKLGIKVEVYDDLINRTGVDARGAADIVNKLVLISKNKETLETLPEETAHFAIRALGKDSPLVKRMVELTKPFYKNILDKNNIDGYNRYKEIYNDESLIQEEAIGQLLGKFLVNQSKSTRIDLLNQYTDSNRNENLYERLVRIVSKIWSQVKSIFNKAKETDIKNEINSIFGRTADDIIRGDISNFDNNAIKDVGPILFSIDDGDLEGFAKVLDDAIKVINKKLAIFKRAGTKEFTDREERLRERLVNQFNNEKYLQGLLAFTANTRIELKGIKDRFNKIESNINSEEPREVAFVLRSMNNFISSYEPILRQLRQEIKESEVSDRAGTILNKIDTTLGDIQDLQDKYYKFGVPVFAKALQEFAADRGEGKNINIEAAIKTADKDISFFQRWLDSIAEADNDILKITDVMVKNYKQSARLESERIQKELINAKIALEKAGVPSANFIYERDFDGNLTGNLLDKYNNGQWEKVRDKFFSDLAGKYNIEPFQKPEEGTKDYIEWSREVRQWFIENTQPNPEFEKLIQEKKDQLNREIRNPKRRQQLFDQWYAENSGVTFKGEEYFKRELSSPSDRYINSAWSEIFNNDGTVKDNNTAKAKAEFYNTIINTKKKADAKLPSRFVVRNRAPQLRKDWVERVKERPKEIVAETFETIKEGLVVVEDDVEFGSQYNLTDEQGKPVNFLPLFFVSKLDNVKDLSTDIVGSLSSYVFMANDHYKMSQIIDVLELGKDMLSEIEVKTGKVDPVTKDPITKKGKEGTKLYERLEDYYTMVVFGKLKAEEGKLLGTNIDQAKAIDFFNRYVSINGLAFNVFAGLQNPIFAGAMVRTEAVTGEYYSQNDLLNADKSYSSELPHLLSQIGQRKQVNKLQLWIEKFDVLQDFRMGLRETDSERKNIFTRLFRMSSLFFINKAGEHWVQSRASIALANSIKLKGKSSGKDYTLWEAYQVNEQGILELQENMTIKADGKTFKDIDEGRDFTEKDLIRVILKQNFINKRLHGIYNEVDRSALQRYAVGRMGLMFRKFIKPGFNRRFKKMSFNEEGAVWTEGYYNTTAKFMANLYKDIKDGQFSLSKNWNDLSATERANMYRTFTEAAYLLAATVLAGILTNMSDDDDENWILNMAAYQASRLNTELAFYINPKETFRILKSPAAGVNQLERMSKFIEFWSWNEEIERGKFKGKTKFEKYVIESVPVVRTVQKLFTPEEELSYYKK